MNDVCIQKYICMYIYAIIFIAISLNKHYLFSSHRLFNMGNYAKKIIINIINSFVNRKSEGEK